MGIITTQKIYDFCKTNKIYNEYSNIPDQFKCDKRQYRYYYHDIRDGLSRAGTYIYHAAYKELCELLSVDKNKIIKHINIHIRSTDFSLFRGRLECTTETLIYCTTNIGETGLSITMDNPFGDAFSERITFVARSHSPYTEEGIAQEVKKYIYKNLLFPKGRYRDLQLKHRVSKSDFTRWYKTYSEQQKSNASWEHYQMIEKYNPRPTYNDCYDMISELAMDFNMDEHERSEVAEELYESF